MKKERQLVELIALLKGRDNGAYRFFEQLLGELRDETTSPAAMERLLTCFAITQYGDFTPLEEGLLSEVIKANS